MIPLITQIMILAGATIGAMSGLVAMYSSLRNRRAIAEVHVSLNSRLDQLVTTTASLARAEGAKDALAQEKLTNAVAKALVLDQAQQRDAPPPLIITP